MKPKIFSKLDNLIKKKNFTKANLIVKRNQFDTNILIYYLNLLFEKKKYELVISTFLKFCKNTGDLKAIKIFSICLIETNDFKRAIIYLKKLVLLDSTSENLSLLAIAQSKDFQINDAINNFEKSLQFSDTTSICFINYANFLREEDRNKEAIKILQKYRGYTTDVNLLTIISGIYRDLYDYDNSLMFCKKALIIEKNNINLLLILGTIHLERGDSKKALETLRKILDINPYFGPALRLISIINEPFNPSELQKILSFLDKSDQSKINNIHLGLAASNFLESEKKYDDSFALLEMYNSRFRETLDFNLDSYISRFEKIKCIFQILNINPAKKKQTTPIFILGLPRSGTSLIEQILSSHNQIFPCGELLYFEKVLKNSLELSKEYFESSETIFRNYTKKVSLNFDINCDYHTDKMPLNFFYIGVINKVFPDSKILLCTRNLMDNMYSIFRNFFPNSNYFSYNLKDLENFIEFYKNVIEYWKIQKCIFYEIKYEELVMNIENEVKNIFNFLNLDFNNNCLNFHENKRVVQTASTIQVKQPLFRSSINRWRNYERQFLKKKIIFNED